MKSQDLLNTIDDLVLVRGKLDELIKQGVKEANFIKLDLNMVLVKLENEYDENHKYK